MADFQKESLKKKNFLSQFSDLTSRELNQLTAYQFIEIWNHYDADSIIDD